jgi:hypothetical protein
VEHSNENEGRSYGPFGHKEIVRSFSVDEEKGESRDVGRELVMTVKPRS